MNFENVNPLNARMNLISGNLYPMTADNSRFTIGWKVYSIAVWSLVTIQCIAFLDKIVISKDVSNIAAILFVLEIFYMTVRIQANRRLIVRFIREMNDALRARDEILKRVVMRGVQQMQTSLKFYLIIGQLTVLTWIMLPLAITSNEPSFSHVMEILLHLLADMYILLKKISLDSYVTLMLQLMTAQYRYITLKLAEIFQNATGGSESGYEYTSREVENDQRMNREMKALCLHHRDVTRASFILKKFLSLHVNATYICNIVRYCLLGMMLLRLDTTSRPTAEYLTILLHTVGSIVEFHIVCFCVQELLDASKELTDKAFHEDWFRCGPSIKRTFLLIVTANKLECKLGKIKNFNLTLPSFLMVLKQAYAFAIFISNVK